MQAEQNIIAAKLNKEYAGIGGEPEFCKEAAKLAFGADSSVITEGRYTTFQVRNVSFKNSSSIYKLT